MKLSNETTNILKNYAAINDNILIKPGSTLETMALTKNFFATAIVSETFPDEIPIFKLSEFLQTLSLFNDPDIEVDGNFILISDASGAVASYVKAATNTLIVPPEKKINMPNPEVTFMLDADKLKAALKAASVFNAPHLTFRGDGENVELRAEDAENSSVHRWSRVIGASDQVFNMVYRTDILKLMEQDYHVAISSKRITQFSSSIVTYYAAAEAMSKFGA